MSDELIRSLKHQLRLKERDMEKLVGEAASRKDRVRELQRQLDAVTGERDGAVKDRDVFKAKAEANPDRSAEELEKLRGELRLFKHRDELARLAYSPEIGVNREVPADHLMKLIGYAPESDDFDAPRARKALVAMKDSHPYVFGSAGGAGQHHAPGMGGAALSPGVAALGPAMGRGSTPNPTGGPGELTEDQMRDPVFMSSYNAKMRAANK